MDQSTVSIRSTLISRCYAVRADRGIGKALDGWTTGYIGAFDIFGNRYSAGELMDEIIRVDYPPVYWSHVLR